jgi:hypothetical protein
MTAATARTIFRGFVVLDRAGRLKSSIGWKDREESIRIGNPACEGMPSRAL